MYNEEEAEVLMACEPISDSWGGSWTEENQSVKSVLVKVVMPLVIVLVVTGIWMIMT